MADGLARCASGAAVTSVDDGLGASGPKPGPPFRHGTCDNPPVLGEGWQAVAEATRAQVWGNTATYEAYMGRWSRPAAETALAWLGCPPGLTWLDVGCGTGALTAAILEAADPHEILGVDPSADFLATSGADCRSAGPLQVCDRGCVRAAGGQRCLRRGHRRSGPALRTRPAAGHPRDDACRPSRWHSSRVWNSQTGERQFTRPLWQAATTLDPAAAALDPGMQSPVCHPESLGR